MQFKTDITTLIYNKVRNRYSAAIFSAKQFHYHKIINEAEGNTKHLYNIMSDVMGRAQENPLPPCTDDTQLANKFHDFFSSKVANIRRELDEIPCNKSVKPHNPLCTDSFTKFNSLGESEVRTIIMKSKSTTCSLDIIPTKTLKSLLDYFLPFITKIINCSLETGIFPKAWKKAAVKPLIKKKGLPLELKNYRPVSNLSFLSKVLEKAALQQVVAFVENHSLLPSYQSAYRRNYGVETTMLKMYGDLLSAADKKMVSLVVMIDLSAAFDTVDIPILLSIMNSRFNIKGTPLKWFESYLTERTMNVVINNKQSDTKTLQYGVPQGSCAGPVVFTLYIAALNTIISSSFPNINLYGYADDHKLALVHFAGNTDSELQAKLNMERCLENVIIWMAEHKLKMNNSKTEIILYGTKQQVSKSNITELNVGTEVVKCVKSVRDLGVFMDSTLTFDLHIRKKCQIANNQLRNIRSVRKHLSQNATEILVHGLIHSHLDFCNGLFSNLPEYQINRLQTIQNRAAKLVVNASYEQPSSPILQSLHWLPVRARIQFKILTTVFKCLNGTAPAYLSDLISIKQHRYSARSSKLLMLQEKRTNTKFADRSFEVVGPRWWNALPAEIRNLSSESSFRRELKTFLFRKSYF